LVTNMQVLITIAVVLVVLIAVGFTPQPLGNKVAMVCEKDWVDILSALGTPIIALMAAWIGYQQWQTSEKARKSAALQRYTENYEKVLKAIRLTRPVETINEAIELFASANGAARVYLDQEIIDYTEELLDTATQIASLYMERDWTEPGPEMVRIHHSLNGLKNKLMFAKPHEVYRKFILIE
jgi:hypothetical protein